MGARGNSASSHELDFLLAGSGSARTDPPTSRVLVSPPNYLLIFFNML